MKPSRRMRRWDGIVACVKLLAMSRASSEELRNALRIGLVERLAPDGWHQVAGDEDRLVGLVRPLADGFVATVEVLQATAYPDRPLVTVTYMSVGVGYEPLRRIAPLLGVFDLDVKDTLVWPPAVAARFGDDADSQGAEQGEEDEPWDPREVRTVEEARALASELAIVVGERAVPFGERYADVDGLLASLPGPLIGSLCQPALLASAGRLDEARASLALIPQLPQGPQWRSRAARQLEWWIDSGGDPALIPDAPPLPSH